MAKKEKKVKKRYIGRGYPVFLIFDMDGTLSQGDALEIVLREIGYRTGYNEVFEKRKGGRKAAIREGKRAGDEMVKRLHEKFREESKELKRGRGYLGMAVEEFLKELLEEGVALNKREIQDIVWGSVKFIPGVEKLFRAIRRMPFISPRHCFILTANAKPIAEVIGDKLGIQKENVIGIDFGYEKGTGNIRTIKRYLRNSKVSKLGGIGRRVKHRLKRMGYRKPDPWNYVIYVGDSISDKTAMDEVRGRGGTVFGWNISPFLPAGSADYVLATNSMKKLLQYLRVFHSEGKKGLEVFIQRQRERRAKYPLVSVLTRQMIFEARKAAQVGDARVLDKMRRATKWGRAITHAGPVEKTVIEAKRIRQWAARRARKTKAAWQRRRMRK